MTGSDPAANKAADALAREAAQWFARMRGPQAESRRDAFDAWLGESPEHRAAYNRAAEIFAMGKLLADPGTPASLPIAAPRKTAPLALTACAAGALVFGGWAALRTLTPAEIRSPAVASTIDQRSLSTITGETRVARLADGSVVHLAGDTMLEVTISSGGRDLRLLRGQARFEVAHERRPFVVLAGDGSVTARGTIFEVQFAEGGKVDVRLLQGAVDVAIPRRLAISETAAVRRLTAGQSVSFPSRASEPATGTPTAITPLTDKSAPSPPEFEAISVSALITQANRNARRPIRLADASLGVERVSGRFRVDDTELLARRLAALFSAPLDATNAAEIVLQSPERPH